MPNDDQSVGRGQTKRTLQRFQQDPVSSRSRQVLHPYLSRGARFRGMAPRCDPSISPPMLSRERIRSPRRRKFLPPLGLLVHGRFDLKLAVEIMLGRIDGDAPADFAVERDMIGIRHNTYYNLRVRPRRNASEFDLRRRPIAVG